MTHTIQYMEGWEHGLTRGIMNQVSGTCAIETARTSYSNSALRFNLSNQSCSIWTYNYVHGNGVLSSGGTYYHRAMWHMWIDTLPSSGQYFGLMYSFGAIARNSARMDYRGKVQGWGGTWSTGSMETGKWYTISVKVENTANITVRERDSGTEIINHSWSGDSSTGNQVRYGPYTNSYGNIVFDNFVCEMSTSAANIADPYDLLGDQYSVLPVRPESNGTLAQFSGGRNYLDMDDDPQDGDTTRDDDYGGDSTTKTNQYGAGTIANYLPEKITIDTIHEVGQASWWRNPSTTNSYNAWTGIVSGGSGYVTSGIDITRYGSSYGGIFKRWSTDPYDSNAWTEAKVEALGQEIRRSRTFTVKWCYCTQVEIQMLATVIVTPDWTPRISMVFAERIRDNYNKLFGRLFPSSPLPRLEEDALVQI